MKSGTDPVFRSWGNYPKVSHAALVPLHWRHLPLPRVEGSMLPVGLARSYGDVCLNETGTLLSTRGLDRLIDFDRANGILTCESGMSLAEILRVVLPAGWFLPVVPGTAHVTVGGAIANDVHGKNHHVAGSFGRHLVAFELLRSDGTRWTCAPDASPELFRATIGGLGLTGLITWAKIRLKSVTSELFEVETVRMENLDHFFALSKTGSVPDFEYSVAWIDALSPEGRGLFMRANHSAVAGEASSGQRFPLSIPFDFPAGILNRHTIRAFNALYRARGAGRGSARQHYTKYLFPLDGIDRWNRMYGTPGFLQHQSVVPRGDAKAKLAEMLQAIAKAGEASFLTVLKVFGDLEPPGLLSFSRPGVTLALDLPMRGASTLALLDRLDAVVRDAGGAIYPAKDARMSPETFRAGFPRWEEFSKHVDPAFSSSFWRRVSR